MKRAILYCALALSGTALLATEGDGQAFTEEGTEFIEIRIHIRGNKELTAALLDAAAKGSAVTGVADFDSLSAVYGLIGIYRMVGMSSGFYGHRFRLRFPLGTNVTAIVEAYSNLAVIKSAKARETAYTGYGISSLGGSKHAAVRIPTKVVFGTLFCVPFTALGTSLYGTYLYKEDDFDHDGEVDPWGGWDSFFYGLVAGGAVGFPVGVTLVDPDDSLPWTLLAGVIPATAGLYFFESEKSVASGFLLAWAYPPFLSLAASELLRNPPEDHRTSFVIAPTPRGGLSGITTLRF